MAGKPVHFEIPAQDTNRAREFYGNLFGWQFDSMEGPTEYHMTRLGEDTGGSRVSRRHGCDPHLLRGR